MTAPTPCPTAPGQDRWIQRAELLKQECHKGKADTRNQQKCKEFIQKIKKMHRKGACASRAPLLGIFFYFLNKFLACLLISGTNFCQLFLCDTLASIIMPSVCQTFDPIGPNFDRFGQIFDLLANIMHVIL